MQIGIEQVEHIARLSRLELTDTERVLFGTQLSNILGYVEKLGELDTSSVEPTSHVLDISNVVRDDTTRASLPVAEALKNAPESTDKFYRVPKIIEL